MENATTIEEAVSLITEPTEAPEAEAPVEQAAEAEEVEVIDEPTEAEEPTQEFESDDDDVDLDDVELDTTPEIEATEETNFIPVKVNGKEEMWTLDQLKQSAAGQGYINQRMQEVAQLEKQYKAQAQQLAEQQQQFLRLQQTTQQIGMTPPKPPSKEMFDSDPIGYMDAYTNASSPFLPDNQLFSPIPPLPPQQTSASPPPRQTSLPPPQPLLQQHIHEHADPAP